MPSHYKQIDHKYLLKIVHSAYSSGNLTSKKMCFRGNPFYCHDVYERICVHIDVRAGNINISVTALYVRITQLLINIVQKNCANGGGKYSSDSCNCDRRTSIMYTISIYLSIHLSMRRKRKYVFYDLISLKGAID